MRFGDEPAKHVARRQVVVPRELTEATLVHAAHAELNREGELSRHGATIALPCSYLSNGRSPEVFRAAGERAG